MLSSFFIQNH